MQLIKPVNDIPDLAVYQAFCFADQADEIIFINITSKKEVNHGTVETFRKLSDNVNILYFTQALNDSINNGVKTDVLDQDIMNFVEEWMISISLEVFFVTLGIGL